MTNGRDTLRLLSESQAQVDWLRTPQEQQTPLPFLDLSGPPTVSASPSKWWPVRWLDRIASTASRRFWFILYVTNQILVYVILIRGR